MDRQLIIDNIVIQEDPIKILSDIRDECNNGKLSTFNVSGSGISVSCPNHKDGLEKNNSCYLNVKNEDLDYLYCHCFTCNFSGSFSKFVGKCFDKTEQWGKKWLISKYSNYLLNDNTSKYSYLKKIDLSKMNDDTHFLNESILNEFESFHPYMIKRHINRDIIKRFNIKYDTKTKSIVFPVYDLNNNLVFLTRRSVEDKKFIIDTNASKKYIYCLNEVLNNNIKEVIVCEGQIDALVSWSYGRPAIALFGAGTTEEQIKELNKTSILHYILMYDNDNAGRKGAEKFKKLINKSCFVTDIIMPKEKDVADCTKDEFIDILNNSVGK